MNSNAFVLGNLSEGNYNQQLILCRVFCSAFKSYDFFYQMDAINILHQRALNLRRRMREIEDGRAAQERLMRLQKEGDTLRSA